MPAGNGNHNDFIQIGDGGPWTIDGNWFGVRTGGAASIWVDSIQKGSRFTHFREEILDEVPDIVFIEILEQGSTFEMSGTNGAQMARIGRDVVASSLPAALMFELSRGL